MKPNLTQELLRFVGQHPFLTLALGAMITIVLLNATSYLRGNISLRTLHKRPHEYMGYVASAMTLVSFINHFLEAGCGK